MRDFHSIHKRLLWAGMILLSSSLYIAGCAFDRLSLSIDKGSLEPPSEIVRP